MRPARYVLIGLGSSRTEWLARLSHWVTSGALSADLSRCLTVEEFRAGLATRAVSVAFVDELAKPLDRDLLANIRAAGAVPVVVAGRQPRRDWYALGAHATLPDDFDLGAVAELLRSRARPVHLPEDPMPAPPPTRPAGRLVAVCGPGGAGSSTVAAGLAQGLAAHLGRRVVLADMALNGEQAVLHGIESSSLGLPGLVDAHRRSTVAAADLDRHLIQVAERSYALATGIHRRRAWATMRPRALHAALTSLLETFTDVVADTDADIEGEPDGGSLDVEERNAMSRCAIARADVVVVVGQPGVKGCYSVLRALEDLWAFGVPENRVVAVVNRCRGGRLERTEIGIALRGLSGERLVRAPVFIPDREVEPILVDGRRLPAWLCDPVASVVRGVLDRLGGRTIDLTDPVPVPVGIAQRSAELWDRLEERPA